MQNRKVILLGATGTVGAYAALDIKKAGFDVVALGRRQSDNSFFADYGIQYQSIDISKREDFAKLPEKDVWAVIHLAGAMPARMKDYNPQEYIDSIMTGTLNVLDYCIKVNADRIIFAQSVSDIIHLYGSSKPIPADSEMRFPINNDHSVYSICKNAAVNLLEHYNAKYGLKRFILRFPNIYLYHPNPYYYVDGQKRMQSYRYIIDRAIRSEEIELWGNPDNVRDMVYVKDCTQIITKSVTAQCNGGTYNVGTGIGTSFRDQIEGIVEVFSPKNKKSNIIPRPDKPDSVQYILDISKTQKDLGYIPKYNYKSYLEDMKKEMQAETFAKLWGRKEDFKE